MMTTALLFTTSIIIVLLLTSSSSLLTVVNAQQQEQQDQHQYIQGCHSNINNKNNKKDLPICFFSMGNWGNEDVDSVGLVGQAMANVAWLGQFTVDATARKELFYVPPRNDSSSDDDSNSTTTNTSTTIVPTQESSSSSTPTIITSPPNDENTTSTTLLTTSTTTSSTTTATPQPPPPTSTSTASSPSNSTTSTAPSPPQLPPGLFTRNASDILCCRFVQVFALGNNFNPRGVESVEDPKWNSILVKQFMNVTVELSLLKTVIDEYNKTVDGGNNTFGIDEMKQFLIENENVTSKEEFEEKEKMFLLKLALKTPIPNIPQTAFRSLLLLSDDDDEKNNNNKNITNNQGPLQFTSLFGPHDGGLTNSEYDVRVMTPNQTRLTAQIQYSNHQHNKNTNNINSTKWFFPKNYYSYDTLINDIDNDDGDEESSSSSSSEATIIRTIVLDTPSLKINCPTEAELRRQQSDANNISISSSNKYRFPQGRLSVCYSQRQWFENVLAESDDNNSLLAVIVLGHDAIAGPIVDLNSSIEDGENNTTNSETENNNNNNYNSSSYYTTDLALDHYLVPLLKKHRVAAYISSGRGLGGSSGSSSSSSSSSSPRPEITSISLEQNLTQSTYETGGLAYIINGQASLTKEEALMMKKRKTHQTSSSTSGTHHHTSSSVIVTNRTCRFLNIWGEPQGSSSWSGKDENSHKYSPLSKHTFAQISSSQSVSSKVQDDSACVADGYFFVHYLEYEKEEEATTSTNGNDDHKNDSSSTGDGNKDETKSTSTSTSTSSRKPIGFIHCAMNHSGIATMCRSVPFRRHIERQRPEQTQLLGLLWGAFVVVLGVVTILACYTTRGSANSNKAKQERKKQRKQKELDEGAAQSTSSSSSDDEKEEGCCARFSSCCRKKNKKENDDKEKEKHKDDKTNTTHGDDGVVENNLEEGLLSAGSNNNIEPTSADAKETNNNNKSNGTAKVVIDLDKDDEKVSEPKKSPQNKNSNNNKINGTTTTATTTSNSSSVNNPAAEFLKEARGGIVDFNDDEFGSSTATPKNNINKEQNPTNKTNTSKFSFSAKKNGTAKNTSDDSPEMRSVQQQQQPKSKLTPKTKPSSTTTAANTTDFDFSPVESEFKFDEMLREERESKELHSSMNGSTKKKPSKDDADI